MFAEAGPGRPLVRRLTVTADRTGGVVLELRSTGRGDALLNGLEVIRAGR